VPACNTEFQTALGTCESKCVSCAQVDCKDQPTNCAKLVGL
jgi:hypothetical protein